MLIAWGLWEEAYLCKTKENVKVVGLQRASLLGKKEVANVKITIFMANVEFLRFGWVADLLINRAYYKNLKEAFKKSDIIQQPISQ